MYNKAYLCLLHSSLSKNHDCVFFARGHVHWNYLLTYWILPLMLIHSPVKVSFAIQHQIKSATGRLADIGNYLFLQMVLLM